MGGGDTKSCFDLGAPGTMKYKNPCFRNWVLFADTPFCQLVFCLARMFCSCKRQFHFLFFSSHSILAAVIKLAFILNQVLYLFSSSISVSIEIYYYNDRVLCSALLYSG